MPSSRIETAKRRRACADADTLFAAAVDDAVAVGDGVERATTDWT